MGERISAAVLKTLVTMGVLGVAASLAACRGPGGDSDEDRVTEAVEQAFTRADPKKCTESATEEYLKQVLPGSDELTVERCERAYESDPEVAADRAVVSEVSVDGEQAQATVAIEGGSDDGQVQDLQLVHDEGMWKLNSLEEVTIDRSRFDAALRASLTRPPGEVPEAKANCLVRELGRAATDAELEQSLIDGDRELLVDPTVTCLGDGDPRRAFETVLGGSLVEQGGLTHGQADCIVNQLRDDVNAEDIQDLLAGEESPGLQAAAQAATPKCIKGLSPVKPRDDGKT